MENSGCVEGFRNATLTTVGNCLELYTYIYIYIYMYMSVCTLTRSPCTNCVHGLATGLSITIARVCKVKAITFQASTGPEAPRYQDIRHMKVVRLSALRTAPWYSFLLEADSTPGP
jgi:hypothetical protein